jgi:hypothetical protein
LDTFRGRRKRSVKGKVSRGKKDLAPNVEPVMIDKHRHLSIKRKMAARVSDESQGGIFFAAKLLSSKHASCDLGQTWRHDIQHNNTQHNDIQHNNELNTTLSITTLRVLLC